MISIKKWEQELRAFLTPEQYNKLLNHLEKETTKKIDLTRQITYYLEHNIDTRIQIEPNSGRVWQKLGRIHDEERYEIEVKMSRKNAEDMLEIFRNMNFGIKAIWYRERRLYQKDNILIALDRTIGYGLILEVEFCHTQRVNPTLDTLRNYLKGLEIEPTKREVFDKAYQNYIETWQTKTIGLNNSWIDELDSEEEVFKILLSHQYQ